MHSTGGHVHVLLRLLAAALLLVAACSADDDDGADAGDDAGERSVDEGPRSFPAAPDVPTGPIEPDVERAIEAAFAAAPDELDVDAVERMGESGDARVGWLLADLLRFFQGAEDTTVLLAAFGEATGVVVDEPFPWGAVSDHLIAWDLPAPPGYVDHKADLFTEIEPGWKPFFTDRDADIDWRWITWGGVLMDDRTIQNARFPCDEGCIPALDDPDVTGAAGGDWYPDSGEVFGLIVDGEARAYPKNVMEVHEMVNDTLGGRRVGIPYCTLCLSAQAYLIDEVPSGIDVPTGTLELRTSGLLSRSNKVMFDLHTMSVIDTFTGVARSGPLQDAGVELEQLSLVTTTWGEWKAAHPDTTVIAQDGGVGAYYSPDPLRGRDDDGPIFPIGAADPRLGVQDRVLGVETADGDWVAFPVIALRSTPGDVVSDEVRIIRDAGGFRAETLDGEPLVSHEAFWFAWSQFHPDTALWSPSS